MALAAAEDPVPLPDAASQLASLPLATLLIDPEGRVGDANPAAEALLGHSINRLSGRALGDLVIPPGIDLLESSVFDHSGWRVIAFITAPKPKDGMPGGAEVRTPAILAHEIKNPLAAIRGAGQLLARRLDARDRPLTDIIAAEVDRIAALIDRMQQLGSAPAAGRGPCNPHQAIRAALTSVRAARGGPFEFLEQFDPSLPPVAADRDVLEQMLINLLTNACDACQAVPAPRIVLQTRYVGGSLPIEIAVLDNGPGVPAEVAEHIFEPFVTGKAHGQGLGLALVRKLAGDLGARIAHDRDFREGTTAFCLNLAIAQDSAP